MEAATDAESAVAKSRLLDEQAKGIIRRQTYWAIGLGIIPFPVLDVAAVTAAQLSMISSLAHLYDQEFSHSLGKSVLGALVGSVGASGLAHGSVGSMIKAVPGIGPLFGMVAMPTMSGATTYAVGKVFNLHFASGGTMLNFDPQKMRDYYQQQLQEGLKIAENATASSSSTTSSDSSGGYGHSEG